MTMPHCAPTVNPTAAESQVADRLAWANDSADNDPLDDYPGPGWQDEPSVEEVEVGPTAEEEAEETGRSIGLDGENPPIESVNGYLDNPWPRPVREAYYRGLRAGRQEHAYRAGYRLGVAGQFGDRPDSISVLFRREFAAGWKLGADAWADRQAIEDEWAAEYAADCQAKMEEDHNREAGGWVRAELTRGGVE